MDRTSTPHQSYIICTAPRSGSTLLCQLLEATGVAGRPTSFFHNASVLEWGRRNGVDLAGQKTKAGQLCRVLVAARHAGQGGTPIFAMRLQRHSFGHFVSDLAAMHPELAGDHARIDAAFGRTLYVHLTRADKLAQAVSYVKAEQSGLWHAAPDGREIERLSPPRAPVFDRKAIAAQMAIFEEYERAWRDWYATEGITPLVVQYEDLARDPIAALARVLAALGLDPDNARSVRVGLKKLADHVSDDWIERFRAGDNHV